MFFHKYYQLQTVARILLEGWDMEQGASWDPTLTHLICVLRAFNIFIIVGAYGFTSGIFSPFSHHFISIFQIVVVPFDD